MENRGHNSTYNAGGLSSQAQPKKQDFSNQCQEGCNQSTQDSSYTAQASNFLHQTGEQVMNMAHGAAEAVKNTLGVNTDNSSTKNTAGSINRPGNPSNTSTKI